MNFSKAIIRYAIGKYKVKKVAIAFSGGLDSLACALLVLDNLPRDIRKYIVFNNTTNEIPESLHYTRMMLQWFEENYQNVKSIEVMAEKHFNEFIFEIFYVAAQMHINRKWKRNKFRCYYFLKEKPAKQFYRKINIKLFFTGLRAEESRQRKIFARETGGVFEKGKLIHVMPIIWWSRKDVIDFINNHPLNPPINPIYEMGFDGTGCMLCPIKFFFAKKSLFALKRHYPKAYQLGISLRNFFIRKLTKQSSLLTDDHPIVNLAKKWLERNIDGCEREK